MLDALTRQGIPGAPIWGGLFYLLVILGLSGILYVTMRLVARRMVPLVMKQIRVQWGEMLFKRGFFNRLAAMTPGILGHVLTGVWMGPGSGLEALGDGLRVAANLWLLSLGVLTLHSLLDGLMDYYGTFSFSSQLPLRGFVQVLKLITVLTLILVSIAMLLGKSPVLLVSGMGAMTAVLMLVFKDPILGFVAGIQLSANRMLAVGDWLEMPKYNADGDVIDVTLTTVKVRNWDQTITTIPTYALISDSFKNWRGINEVGGRRIMRSVHVDMHSVRFLTPEDIERLCEARLLTDYIRRKIADIERDHHERGVDSDSPVNARRLTNIGTFRAYLTAYLKSHSGIHQGMIIMVRQLQPTPEGLPLQLYAFTSDTAWVAHESVQADIFDHVIAVAPEFGLRVFQSPSGNDFRRLGFSGGDSPQ